MKNAGIAALVVLVLASIGYMVFGMADGENGAAVTGAGVAGGEGNAVATGDDEAAAGAPIIRPEGNEADDDPEKAKDLRIPGQLPSLDLPQLAIEQAPVKPHSEVELEGTIGQVDAEMAIRAVFPKIRGCYVELRDRAPQARGRMLMKMKVRKGDDGSAGTGELFLKETQFTDPKYLSCVRTSIDETKFKTDAAQIDGSFTFTLWLSPEDVDNHNKAAPADPAAGSR